MRPNWIESVDRPWRRPAPVRRSDGRSTAHLCAHHRCRLSPARRRGRPAGSSAAVADILLDDDALELRAHDGAGRASLHARRGRSACRCRSSSASCSGTSGRLIGNALDEGHVAPGGGPQVAGIVVAVPRSNRCCPSAIRSTAYRPPRKPWQLMHRVVSVRNPSTPGRWAGWPFGPAGDAPPWSQSSRSAPVCAPACALVWTRRPGRRFVRRDFASDQGVGVLHQQAQIVGNGPAGQAPKPKCQGIPIWCRASVDGHGCALSPWPAPRRAR